MIFVDNLFIFLVRQVHEVDRVQVPAWDG
jgi:hypothetical protein